MRIYGFLKTCTLTVSCLIRLAYPIRLGNMCGVYYSFQKILDNDAPSCFVFQVMDFWNHTDFQLSAHPNRDIAVITGADDIITSVEESQVTLSNIRGSRFVTPIKV